MKARQGMLLYHDDIHVIQELPDKEFKELILALLALSEGREHKPPHGNNVGMAYMFLANKVRRDIDAYTKRCKTNKDNADKRWGNIDATTCDCNQSYTTACDRIQTDAVDANQTYPNVPPTQPSATKSNPLTPTTEPYAKQDDVRERFAELWNTYPRKEAFGAAESAYIAVAPDATTHQRMLSAVICQSRSDAWLRDDGRFVPHLARWLSERRWEDMPAGSLTPSTPTDVENESSDSGWIDDEPY